MNRRLLCVLRALLIATLFVGANATAFAASAGRFATRGPTRLRVRA